MDGWRSDEKELEARYNPARRGGSNAPNAFEKQNQSDSRDLLFALNNVD
jgi:hypothetical protein